MMMEQPSLAQGLDPQGYKTRAGALDTAPPHEKREVYSFPDSAETSLWLAPSRFSC